MDSEYKGPLTVGNQCDHDLAQALWRGQACLAIDSIQFGDGTVALLTYHEPLTAHASILSVIRRCTWLTVIVERLGNPLHSATLSQVDCMAEIATTLEGHELRIECGECGGHGSFGYVAVEVKREALSNELLWVAFFCRSNPFDSLSIDGGELHALSTCGYRYSFQLCDPTCVSVQKREDLMWWGSEGKDEVGLT